MKFIVICTIMKKEVEIELWIQMVKSSRNIEKT